MDDVWYPVRQDEEPFYLKNWTTVTRPFMDYLVNTFNVKNSTGRLADVADNLINLNHKGKMYIPRAIAATTFPPKYGQNVYKDAISYAEAPQMACARYKPCQLAIGGYWVRHILDELRKKHEDPDSVSERMVIYTTHAETSLSALYLMEVNENDVSEMPTSAGFYLEYKPLPTPVIRITSHEAADNDNDDVISERRRKENVVSPCWDENGDRIEWCDYIVWRRKVEDNIAYLDQLCSGFYVNKAQTDLILIAIFLLYITI